MNEYARALQSMGSEHSGTACVRRGENALPECQGIRKTARLRETQRRRRQARRSRIVKKRPITGAACIVPIPSSLPRGYPESTDNGSVAREVS